MPPRERVFPAPALRVSAATGCALPIAPVIEILPVLPVLRVRLFVAPEFKQLILPVTVIPPAVLVMLTGTALFTKRLPVKVWEAAFTMPPFVMEIPDSSVPLPFIETAPTVPVDVPIWANCTPAIPEMVTVPKLFALDPMLLPMSTPPDVDAMMRFFVLTAAVASMLERHVKCSAHCRVAESLIPTAPLKNRSAVVVMVIGVPATAKVADPLFTLRFLKEGEPTFP